MRDSSFARNDNKIKDTERDSHLFRMTSVNTLSDCHSEARSDRGEKSRSVRTLDFWPRFLTTSGMTARASERRSWAAGPSVA